MLARVVSRLPAAFHRATKCDNAVLRQPTHLANPNTIEPVRTHLPPSPTSNLSRHYASSSSSSSSTRWKSRQSRDSYAREAKVAGLKSRAAYKLLEINEKHHLFRRGDTVVDLGFAPGSWSQVAVNRVSPGGRVVGIDVIPAQPPRGANALQGNFLSEEIREELWKFVSDPLRGRVRSRGFSNQEVSEDDLEEDGRGVVELSSTEGEKDGKEAAKEGEKMSQKEVDVAEGRVVNVVLSDMMLNTSGVQARDHGKSMDLCMAALTFAYDTLAAGGNFLAKFYTGAEDHAFELRLKKLFEKVHRVKPDATRKESKEAYFVGLRRKAGVAREDVLGDG